MTRWQPSVPLASASDKKSFAYESTVRRWPIILTGISSELNRVIGDLKGEDDKVGEGKALINSIGGFIYDMRHDRELPDLPLGQTPDDTQLYNDELAIARANGHSKWFTASWLFAECYMYRHLRILFASTEHWQTFDPFAKQKLDAFRSSDAGIHALAKSLQARVERGKELSEKELEAEWTAMLEIDLWGNATDLSLLTSLSHDEIEALQSVERGANFVLKNDIKQSWDHVKSLNGARIDIVLDNSGFELVTDLALADWLLSVSPFAKEVVFHPKLMPWFVSDVQPHDFSITINSLLDPTFFPETSTATEEDKQALRTVVERWAAYVKDGKFRLSTPNDLVQGQLGGEIADFWTTPLAFSDLPHYAPALLADLQKSSLVIFKGDLNYRKLTADANWPTTTPFEETLGPLRGKFDLLSLRTCKADVCVGLQEGAQERLDREDPTWRVSGKYAVVSFVPRA